MADNDLRTSRYDPRDLIADTTIGVLATLKSNGLPQLSPVTAVYDRTADVIYISMTADRAKTKNLRRDPRAAIEYTSPDGYTWATAEGSVTLTGPATDSNGPEVDALVEYYRLGAGEHPDWAEYREVMVTDRRVLAALHISRVYGQKLR
ncbi:MAG: PPOX class F420-dependent oxidoreductase [Gordonia sp. (in: high G+C Gram-positive bacteria)]